MSPSPASKMTPSPKVTPSGTWLFSGGISPEVTRRPPLPRGWEDALGELASDVEALWPQDREWFSGEWDSFLAGGDLVLGYTVVRHRQGGQVELRRVDEDRGDAGVPLVVPFAVLRDMVDAFREWLAVTKPTPEATPSPKVTPSGTWRFSAGLRPVVTRVPALPREWLRALADVAWDMHGAWPDRGCVTEDWDAVAAGEHVVFDQIGAQREGDGVRLDALYGPEQWWPASRSVVIPLAVVRDLLDAYWAWLEAGHAADTFPAGREPPRRTTPSPKTTPTGQWLFSPGPLPGVRRKPPLPPEWVSPLSELAGLMQWSSRRRERWVGVWGRVLAGEEVCSQEIAARREGDCIRLEALHDDQWEAGGSLAIPLTVVQDMVDSHWEWLQANPDPLRG